MWDYLHCSVCPMWCLCGYMRTHVWEEGLACHVRIRFLEKCPLPLKVPFKDITYYKIIFKCPVIVTMFIVRYYLSKKTHWQYCFICYCISKFFCKMWKCCNLDHYDVVVWHYQAVCAVSLTKINPRGRFAAVSLGTGAWLQARKTS